MSALSHEAMSLLSRLGPRARLVVVKGGGIGDFLAITPALAALRAALPKGEMALVTSEARAPLARRYECLDRVLVSPPAEGVIAGEPDNRAIAAFFRQMQREQFDLGIQLHGGGRHSNPFLKRLGAGVTAGYKGSDAEPLDVWLPYDDQQHEVLRALDLANLLGAPPARLETWLPVGEPDLQALAELDGRIDLNGLAGGRYLGLHAGAGSPSRRWPAARFAWVADRLLEEFDLDGVLVTGGPAEQAEAAAVVAESTHPERYVNLAGDLPFEAFVALLTQVRLLLTNDSGPSHMAVALNTPCVIVYGAGPPLNWAPLLRAWHRPVADWTAPCRWFADDGCPERGDLPCLLNVQAQAVLQAAREVLQLTAAVRPALQPTGPEPRHFQQRGRVA